MNRGTGDWATDGHVLPPFGFIAKAGECESDVTRRDGVISAHAKSPDLLFVDARPNGNGRMVDFGPAATNGAFRLIHGGGNWQLIPLPGSPAFHVELHLDQLNAKGEKVRAITAVNSDGNAGPPVVFHQDGQAVCFDTSDKVFSYRISLAPPAESGR